MDQTITLHPQGTPTNSGYALLIGVDHYDTLGSAAELSGSRNDVLMWHWFCRQHLGIPAENIRMLTSPRLDPGKDFGGDPVPAESLGDASEASIRAGYAWLLERMNGGKNPGLLAYSGHGLLLANGRPALSASDVTAGGKGGIPLQELGEAVSKASAQQMLTAIFDCCHVAAPASVGDLRTCTGLSYGAESAPSIEDEAFNVSHRVFLAASPGRPAYQGKLGRSVHGALSFALVTAAEQWKASQAPGQTGLDVNNKELFKRAKKLLRALRMKQSPKLRVPFDAQSRSAVRKMPFFGMAAGITARTPDAVRERIQTDPGLRNDYRVYTITDKAGDFTAYILVQNAHPQNTIPSGWGYSAGTEYWYVSSTAAPTSTLTFTWTDYVWTNNPRPPSFTGLTEYTTTQLPKWGLSSALKGTKPTAFCSNVIAGVDGTTYYLFFLAWDLGETPQALNWYVATTGSSLARDFTVFGSTYCTYPNSSVSFTVGNSTTVLPAAPSGSSWTWSGSPTDATQPG